MSWANSPDRITSTRCHQNVVASNIHMKMTSESASCSSTFILLFKINISMLLIYFILWENMGMGRYGNVWAVCVKTLVPWWTPNSNVYQIWSFTSFDPTPYQRHVHSDPIPSSSSTSSNVSSAAVARTQRRKISGNNSKARKYHETRTMGLCGM